MKTGCTSVMIKRLFIFNKQQIAPLDIFELRLLNFIHLQFPFSLSLLLYKKNYIDKYQRIKANIDDYIA